MQNLAYATVLILFFGAAVAGLSPRAAAKWFAPVFALAAFAAAVALAYAFAAAGKPALTIDLVSFGKQRCLALPAKNGRYLPEGRESEKRMQISIHCGLHGLLDPPIMAAPHPQAVEGVERNWLEAQLHQGLIAVVPFP